MLSHKWDIYIIPDVDASGPGRGWMDSDRSFHIALTVCILMSAGIRRDTKQRVLANLEDWNQADNRAETAISIFTEVPSGVGSLTPPYTDSAITDYSRATADFPLVQRLYKKLMLLCCAIQYICTLICFSGRWLCLLSPTPGFWFPHTSSFQRSEIVLEEGADKF